MYHFWYYVAISYVDGAPTATGVNILHETPIYEDSETGRWLVSNVEDGWILINNGVGTSFQDYRLGQAGVRLGMELVIGEIGTMSMHGWPPETKPQGVGVWIRVNLGD